MNAAPREIWITEEDFDTASLYESILEAEGFSFRHFSRSSQVPAEAPKGVAGLLYNLRHRDPQSLAFLSNFQLKNPHCKVLLLYGGLRLDDNALGSLGWRWLRKPFDLEDLLLTLKEI